MPADFISRNPNIAAGRDAFIQVLRTNPTLLQNHRQRVPEVEFAKNDYVFLMWANFIIDPMEPAKIYKFNTLDLFRIADGKIVEHRDGAHKSAEGDFGAKGQGGGVYNSSTKLTPKEQETRRLGMVEFKDILQYGHTELALQAMAPGYMQHNVNVPGGRDNFNQELQQPAEEADRGQVGDTADARAHYRQLLPEVRPAPRARSDQQSPADGVLPLRHGSRGRWAVIRSRPSRSRLTTTLKGIASFQRRPRVPVTYRR